MAKQNKWPGVSIVIPTLNSARTLNDCLKSLAVQKYSGRIEVILVDGGSIDATVSIAKKYKVKIFKNRLVTAEAGKAVGFKKANEEIIGFVDSDNILTENDWIKRIVEPMVKEKNIICSEPINFSYRKTDQPLTRYFALLGMGDPLNLFIGWYDKYSFITDKWTSLKIKTIDKSNFLTFFIKTEIPTIGANGFFIRKEYLKKYPIKDYLFDIDVLKFLSRNQKIKVAKVKIGIVHLFSGNIQTFIRKQTRRIRDFFYFQKQMLRQKDKKEPYIYIGIIKFIFSTIFIIPLFVQAFIGYLRKNDWVWLFHPLICWITLFVYVIETIKMPFNNKMFERTGWKQ